MWTVMSSPIGDLRIVEHDGAVTAIEFSPFRPSSSGRPLGDRADDHPLLVETVAQLTAYFARDRKDFDLPLAPRAAPPSSRPSGTRCSASATARPRRTARSRTGSARPTPPRARSAWPTARTRSRS